MDFNGLVGYIGSYIGLILGYSLLQIPQMIPMISRHLKKYLAMRSSDEYNDTTQVNIEEASCENIKLGSTTTTTSAETTDFTYITEL